jgi:plastocyanin
MKRFALLSLFALAGFALAACGDDDDDAATTTPEPAATKPAPGGGEPRRRGGGPGRPAPIVKVSAPKDGSFAFTPNKLDAKAGPLAIEFTNPAAVSHDLVVDAPAPSWARTKLISDGDTDAVVFPAKAGTYTYYCDVPGHREGGMEGTLTVK